MVAEGRERALDGFLLARKLPLAVPARLTARNRANSKLPGRHSLLNTVKQPDLDWSRPGVSALWPGAKVKRSAAPEEAQIS
jgi:hypothetical protein